MNEGLRIRDVFKVDFGKGFDGAVGEKVAGREYPEFSSLLFIFTGNKKYLSLIVTVHDLAVRIDRPVSVNTCKNK